VLYVEPRGAKKEENIGEKMEFFNAGRENHLG